jgi:hypothetical protein
MPVVAHSVDAILGGSTVATSSTRPQVLRSAANRSVEGWRRFDSTHFHLLFGSSSRPFPPWKRWKRSHNHFSRFTSLGHILLISRFWPRIVLWAGILLYKSLLGYIGLYRPTRSMVSLALFSSIHFTWMCRCADFSVEVANGRGIEGTMHH